MKFTCTEPTNIDFLFFIKFRDIYILPEHLLGDLPLDQIRTSNYWDAPIGSGPCVYENQISGERMEFTANKNYHLKTPQWDRFVVRVVTTPNLLSGLMNNEIVSGQEMLLHFSFLTGRWHSSRRILYVFQ